MKSTLFVLVGLVIAAGVLAASVVVPTLQTPRIQANSQVNEHLERARRLLYKYDTNLSVESDYRYLVEADEFKLSSDRLAELIQDPDFDIIEETNSALAEYVGLPEVKRLSAAEQELLKLQYGERWQDYSSPRPPGRMTGAGMATKGSREYEQRLADNAKILAQALAEVNQALAISIGDFNAKQHASANRLLGIIYYQQGLAGSRKVQLMRAGLASQRFALKQALGELAAVIQNKDLVQHSAIEDRLAEARQQEQEMLQAVDRQGKLTDELQSRVNDLEAKLAAALARSEAAREAMETLQDFGVDLSTPGGFEEFKKAYEEQSQNYRDAVVEAHMIESGSLINATIDYTGDYLEGLYEPISPDQEIETRRGLVHYRQDLDSALAQLEKMNEVLAVIQENIESLEHHKRNLQNRAQIALDAVEKRRQQITSRYPEFKALDEDTRRTEDQAIASFEKAETAFQMAERGIHSEVQRAREDQPGNPERRPYHYSHVAAKDMKWYTGQVQSQQADTKLRTAFLLLGRYQDAQANLSDLAPLPEAFDITEDQAAWTESADAQRTEAIVQIESAIDLLQNKAKGNIGEGNWLVAAEIGAAHYMLSLLDVELAAERSLEWFSAALQDRQDKQFAQQYVAMRDYIIRRQELEAK